jgi:hypothetical protein
LRLIDLVDVFPQVVPLSLDAVSASSAYDGVDRDRLLGPLVFSFGSRFDKPPIRLALQAKLFALVSVPDIVVRE